LRRQRDLCQRIANQLASERDYDKVSIRPVTGSVIIERDASPLDPPNVIEHLEAVLSHEVTESGPRTDADGARATRLAAALAAAVRGLNADVNLALDGEADLATLGPFALLAFAAAHVSITGNLPAAPWSSLVWYAIRSFISFNPAAMGKEKAPAPSGVDAPHPHDLVGGGQHEERPTP
jgi:hypothetical protein